MSDDRTAQDYVMLSRKTEVAPTPERFRKLSQHGNLELGGTGRMEEASVAVRILMPFDILHQEVFDRDYSSALYRFRAAFLAFSSAHGSAHGRLGDAPCDPPTGIPLPLLYSKLLREHFRGFGRHINRRRWAMLQALIKPLEDSLSGPADPNETRRQIMPMRSQAEDALQALEAAMLAIEKEEERKRKLEEREAQRNEEWLAVNNRPRCI